MPSFATASLLVAGVAASPAAASPPSGRGLASVQLFEWSWADIALECEQWLGPKGFKGIQIPPPTEHIPGDMWWTRYQPVTYNLTSRSGDEAAFVDMIQRCKKVGVDIYADAVFNHVAHGEGRGIAGSYYANRSTPLFAAEDMHHVEGNVLANCGVDDYKDAHQVQYCDLVGLPDLCTASEKVQKTVAEFINRMVDMGVAGLRIDGAKHMKNTELAQLLARTPSNIHRTLEVIHGDGEPITPEMYFDIGSITEFQYFRKLAPLVKEGKLSSLDDFGEGFMPEEKAVVFIDNHDTQRTMVELTYKDGKLYELASVFMLAHPYGYPRVMSSYYFSTHDQGPPKTPVHAGGKVACGDGEGWVCEHRWPAIANMVAWRLSAGETPITSFQAPGEQTIALCRGEKACLALNRGDKEWEVFLKFSLPAGDYCDVIQSDDVASCPKVSIAKDGTAMIKVPPMGSVAMHVGKKVDFEVVV